MAKKEELVTAIIHVRQSWVETTGASTIFAAANVALGQGDILGIPVTRWDISDEYFVEFTFYPRVTRLARFPRSRQILFAPLSRIPFLSDWPAVLTKHASRIGYSPV